MVIGGHRQGRSELACIAAMLTSLAACTPGPLTPRTAAAPSSGPVVAASSNPSSGTVESTRRALMGTWDLAALEYLPPGAAVRTPVEARGTLIYDEFGNLTIDAQTTDPRAPIAARERNVLFFKGRAVIDVAKQELKLMDVTGNVNPDEVLSPDRRRRYEVDADTLKLSSFDERGQVTAISSWRRRR